MDNVKKWERHFVEMAKVNGHKSKFYTVSNNITPISVISPSQQVVERAANSAKRSKSQTRKSIKRKKLNPDITIFD